MPAVWPMVVPAPPRAMVPVAPPIMVTVPAVVPVPAVVMSVPAMMPAPVMIMSMPAVSTMMPLVEAVAMIEMTAMAVGCIGGERRGEEQ
jgi:hypothetical protein